jgi:hypothetical protein
MNIFRSAAKACRPFLLALPALRRAVSHAASRTLVNAAPAFESALESALETIARVLCVQSRGVVVCGASGGSVAHLADTAPTAPR